MRKIFAIVAVIAAGIASAATAQDSAPVEVMVVGTWHFDSPGLDLNNPEVDDVLKPKRQRELEAVSAALTEYRPTKILIERTAKTPDLIDTVYSEFTGRQLTRERDERFQIAYRLAKKLGHTTVYAIDEQAGPGEPDYFPFDRMVSWAKANDAEGRLDALLAKGAAEAGRIETLQSETIPRALIEVNQSGVTERAQTFYYEALKFGDTEAQPGAELNSYWYMRNAKIFAKLARVAEPGDRLLVIYGSGHNYWLRHFAETVPGFRMVSPVPWLERADAALR